MGAREIPRIFRLLARRSPAGYDVRGMDETALIRSAQGGDLDAFNSLILVYQDRTFNLAYRIMGDRDAASDATQEAFISAFKSIKRFRGGSFRSWLFRITTNACYDELRRRKRQASVPLEADLEEEPERGYLDRIAAADEAPEQSAARAELRRAIEDCLNRLPQEFRSITVLVDIQGFDYRAAAEVIGKPVGTVKSRLARARGRMRDCLRSVRELLPSGFRLEGESL